MRPLRGLTVYCEVPELLPDVLPEVPPPEVPPGMLSSVAPPDVPSDGMSLPVVPPEEVPDEGLLSSDIPPPDMPESEPPLELPEVPPVLPAGGAPAAPGAVLLAPPDGGSVVAPGVVVGDSDGGGLVDGAVEAGGLLAAGCSPLPPPSRLQAATLIVSRPVNIRIFDACSFGFIAISFQLTMKSSPSVLTEACCISFNTGRVSLRFSKVDPRCDRRKSGRSAVPACIAFDARQENDGTMAPDAAAAVQTLFLCGEPMANDKSLKRFGQLYGSSIAMDAMYRQLERVAATDATVLLEGESGTGKELIAQTVHLASRRADRQFVAVNCGAIPAHLIEAALFGHEKGSFTGAMRQQSGYFEYASGGTLFLDEITEMPCDMQVKLLRVLESGCFHRVGGSEQVRVDVRMIAATNRALQAAVEEGSLRQDLMYRLAVFPVRVPPLRERGQDIELLARHFLGELNAAAGTRKQFSRQALDCLRQHTWPGNVRELKNLVHRAYILASDVVQLDTPLARSNGRPVLADGMLSFPVGTPLADAQRELIMATLNHFSGNKRMTASALGISVKTLYNRLKEY